MRVRHPVFARLSKDSRCLPAAGGSLASFIRYAVPVILGGLLPGRSARCPLTISNAVLIRALLALLLFFGGTELSASAQVDLPEKPQPVERDTSETAQDLLRQANQHLVRRDPASAIPLLEEANQLEPSPAIRERLRDAYTDAGRHEDALRLLEEQLSATEPTVYILSEKGKLESLAGHTEEANDTWEEAISLQPESPETYRLVSGAARAAEAYDFATVTLERGREVAPDDDTLLLQLGLVSGTAGDPEASIGYHLDFLENRVEQTGLVKTRLERQLGNPEASDIFRRAIDEAVREQPFHPGYRELSAWLALSEGDFETALDAALAIDRISNENGETVLAYAQSAAREGALEAAENALADLLTRHADEPISASARLERARIADLRARESNEQIASAEDVPPETPLTDTARDAYEEFLDQHPGHPGAAEAQRRLATLYRTVYRDTDTAEELLADLAETARDPLVSGEALLDLGDAAIVEGNLYEARRRFESVKDRIRTGDLSDEARFELAQIDFYEGFFFTALSRLEAIDDNTAANVTNDAISLRVTLAENINPDSTAEALTAYARASLLIRRNREEQAVHVLDSLMSVAPQHSIVDDARFTKGRALLAAGNAQEAANVFATLPEQFPESFFADRALLLLGEVRERRLADAPGAQEAYLALLERYPASLFAPLARERLRALRSNTPSS